jgi:hypothetical protein
MTRTKRTREDKLFQELLHLVQEQAVRTVKLETLTDTERKQYRRSSNRIKRLLRYLLTDAGQEKNLREPDMLNARLP